ncbi:NAD(P)-dependent dehydrogenase, short-chain alcohol dehydrogenase family [Microbacterium azadirachtae]|uniref:NAD(P)-dependent dehydrogenase, short-chain alcohol dehydrogenase family n=1 Tax=Microbacterium azadirachtae TaxID=582680 RepID=A0A1I6J2Z8_9MICO|nr:SDR family oxidoreductase [Microbacterium azadirachtae]SFR73394.1 NAD(P)-dependent dehydrogenase, short-chain alcohol dehydrogenase family [Microbacterium azadirachtae]
MPLTDFALPQFSLAGKRAIVTGGNTGLGRAFTVALAAAGADVFVPGLAPDDGTTERLVAERGRRFVFAEADVTTAGTPARMVDACVQQLGGLDILVNSAGISLLDDVIAFDRSKWDPMVAVNLTAAFDFAHEAARVMIPQGSGKIVSIASLFSFLGGRRSPAYAATKAGIVGLTKAYADELGEYGIQVNALAPGYFATAITEATRADPVSNQRIIDHTPAARWGDPADLMGPLVFLCSSASDYVNGHTLTVDGGYLVR